MAKKFPWKSGFAKIPTNVSETLEGIASDVIRIATTKIVSREDIEQGMYSHVGIVTEKGEISATSPSTPPEWTGKWSKRNLTGWDRKRTDWPKVQKTWMFEAPNFGDGARNGYSIRTRTRDVFQHQIFEPQGIEIDSTVIEDRGGEKVVFKFEIHPSLSKSMPEFELFFLWHLNVLQENVGAIGVFVSDVSDEEFAKSVALDWEVFPNGSVDEIVAKILAGKKAPDAGNNEALIRERLAIFEKFKPKNYLHGLGSFNSYFGAQFADDFVVFENLKYGNAIYLLYEDWEAASKRSRIDLLRDQDAHFDRVKHTEGWQAILEAMIQDKLAERGLAQKRRSRRPRRRPFPRR